MITPKTILFMIGCGLIVQGLVFYAFAEPLTDQNFPGANSQARHVGIIMRQSLAALSCLAGLVVLLACDAEKRTTKKILFGCAIGFAAIGVMMIKNLTDKSAVIPLPALGLYFFTSFLALYMAFRKK